MKYGDVTIFLVVEEKTKDGDWKPVAEFMSWRADSVQGALCGISGEEEMIWSPMQCQIDLNNIRNGKQRVTIRAMGGHKEDVVKWLKEIKRS
jgi:hypothetical protein